MIVTFPGLLRILAVFILLPFYPILTISTFLANSADTEIFFLILSIKQDLTFLANGVQWRHLMKCQILSTGDNLQELSNPVSGKNKKK